MPLQKQKKHCSFSAQPGNTMMEYGVVAALVLLIAIPGLYLAGGQLRQWTDGLKTNLTRQRDTAVSVSQQASAQSKATLKQEGYAYTLSSRTSSSSDENSEWEYENPPNTLTSGNEEIYGDVDTVEDANTRTTVTRTGRVGQNPSRKAPRNPKKIKVTTTRPQNLPPEMGGIDAFTTSKGPISKSDPAQVSGGMGRPLGNGDMPSHGSSTPPQTAGAAGHPIIPPTTVSRTPEDAAPPSTASKPKKNEKKSNTKKTDTKKPNQVTLGNGQTYGLIPVNPKGPIGVAGGMGVKLGPPPKTTTQKTKVKPGKVTLGNGKTFAPTSSNTRSVPAQVAGAQARMAYNPKSPPAKNPTPSTATQKSKTNKKTADETNPK